jgi:hypothetical protein
MKGTVHSLFYTRCVPTSGPTGIMTSPRCPLSCESSLPLSNLVSRSVRRPLDVNVRSTEGFSGRPGDVPPVPVGEGLLRAQLAMLFLQVYEDAYDAR